MKWKFAFALGMLTLAWLAAAARSRATLARWEARAGRAGGIRGRASRNQGQAGPTGPRPGTGLRVR